MEIVLLLLIFAILIYIKNGIDSRFNGLELKLFEISRLLDLLKKEKQELQETLHKIPQQQMPPKAVQPIVAEEQQPIAVVAPEPQIIPVPETPKIPIAEIPKVVAAPIEKPKPAYIPPAPPQKSWWENFKEQNPDLEKFIGENLINKIGVLILVLGISYFVKYAIDKDWINEPARVGIGILCGALILGFAHKLRKNYAAFSSVLVAGAIAIFYFTIGIAFHDYHLFNQTVAFVIMVVITAFSALISLSYDRKELAVLSLIGGFAVPFMVSTGEGNYAVLFTYITILNIGILALAYHKKWNIINILSYVFTIILYGSWLAIEMQKDQPHYLGALIFGFVFYVIFILINIINNLRTKGSFTTIELCILASNTFLFYAAGMVILNNFHPEFKGLFTTFLALLNLVYAWFLYKKFGLDKTAVYLLIGLTLTFVTLAIPIQFKGNYITLFWAGEAVLLLWLSQKSKISGYRFGSVIVHFLMLFSLIIDWVNIYSGDDLLQIVANPVFITGIVAIASFLIVHKLLKNETEPTVQFGITFNPQMYRSIVLVIAIVTAYFTGIIETAYQANDYLSNNGSAVAVPVTFHLIFCAVLFYFLVRTKKTTNLQMASIIAILNVVLYVVLFSRFAFQEHENYISTGIYNRIAFYLHYISLAIALWFVWQLFQMNRKALVFEWFGSRFTIWVAAFFIAYIASSEVMLHSLVFSNTPVTMAELQADSDYKFHQGNDLGLLKDILTDSRIDTVRNQVIKTGFPILWGILAFAFLIVGIKIQNKTLRIVALALLGITILKLFLFDIRNVSETGKIVAFILLGILILIISFVYQKIKVLVLDDNKTAEDEKTA